MFFKKTLPMMLMNSYIKIQDNDNDNDDENNAQSKDKIHLKN